MTNQPRRGFEGGRSGPPQGRPVVPRLPEGYLKDGYFDAKGNIRCELVSDLAETVAKALGNAGVTSGQLRRFFGQVRALERDLRRGSFPESCGRIEALKAKAANYAGRGTNRDEREKREVLKAFIDRNVGLAMADSGKGFLKGFVPHFESVVAYYKYHFPTK